MQLIVSDYQLQQEMAKAGLTESSVQPMTDVETLIATMNSRGIKVVKQVTEAPAGGPRLRCRTCGSHDMELQHG